MKKLNIFLETVSFIVVFVGFMIMAGSDYHVDGYGFYQQMFFGLKMVIVGFAIYGVESFFFGGAYDKNAH